MTNTYEYHGLLAQTWDLHRADAEHWDDMTLYRALAQHYGAPVLELGCATGRLVLPFLEQGIETDGLDNSAELLAICREKAQKRRLAPTLYEQDLRSLDLPRRYKTIIASSSVFQLVTDEAEARQALERIFAHLEPGGAFVASFSFEWRDGDPLSTSWQPHFTVTRPDDGAIVRAFSREWHEPEKRLWHAELRYEVEKNGQVVARESHLLSPEGRSYTQEQALQLYSEVGFTNLRTFNEFTQEPAHPDVRLFCVLGERPTAP